MELDLNRLKTDPALIDKLKQANPDMSPEEAYKQKLSFVFSMMGNGAGMTRESVEMVIRNLEGMPSR